jgi:signal transduction histidine kinase
LHVSSARLAVEHDPADAARSLAEAERVGRQTLAEVRATMGLLRTGDQEALTAPAPGADQLPSLVEQVREAGTDVTLVVEGKFGSLPATIGSTVYRIVQEALTNAAKHAAGSIVVIRVAVDRQSVDVRVESGGAPGHGAGHGLSSMRDRAQAVGGTCQAGPGGQGWLVHASLPLGFDLDDEAP